jgi:hypothetical protein
VQAFLAGLDCQGSQIAIGEHSEGGLPGADYGHRSHIVKLSEKALTVAASWMGSEMGWWGNRE